MSPKRILRTRWSFLAAASFLLACGGSPTAPEITEEPSAYACAGCSVVLISLDTLRADRLGAYGHDRATSPHIDALADRSILFERANSVSYHTADSHMSMFTSTFPSVHLVRNAARDTGRPLDPVIPTLAEVLQDGGYRTVGFHGGGNISSIYGFDRGFEVYRKSDVDAAIAWLAGDGADDPRKPFFLFFHAYYTHDPYTPESVAFGGDYQGDILSDRDELLELTESKSFLELRDTFWERVDPADPADLERLFDLYDSELLELDAQVGRLLAAVEERGERTLVILTSDHGEEFHEHGRFLHDQLYDELLHVPLILHHPDLPPKRVATRVSLLDLAPTLVGMLGIEKPESFQGGSLAQVAEGQRTPAFVFSEKIRRLPEERGLRSREFSNWALVAEDRKVIVRKGVETYDLVVDPAEQNDLALEHPASRELVALGKQVLRQNAELRDRLGVGQSATEQPLDPETRDQLKALGYLQ
ncbi:MAG: sulfatase [Acidobacteriota bacterium]